MFDPKPRYFTGCFSVLVWVFSADFHYKKQLKITETCLFFPFTKGVLKLTDVMLRKLQAPGPSGSDYGMSRAKGTWGNRQDSLILELLFKC